MIDTMKKMMGPLKQRIMLAISRAVVETIKDNQGLQSMQVSLLADEVQDDVERFQNYGLTSVPPKGSEGVLVCPGGDRSHGILIAVDSRTYRLKGLAEGEVALYTDEGDFIKLKRGNEIEISTQTLNINASSGVNVTTPTFHVSGVATVSGNISSGAMISDSVGTMASMRQVFNTHTHPENGDGGGTTSPPNQSM